MRVQMKTRGTYCSNRPRNDRMRRAMMTACWRKMMGLVMSVWQCLLGVFGLASLSSVRFTRSFPPSRITARWIRPGWCFFHVVWSRVFSRYTGDCLTDGPSSKHVHRSRRQITLADTATAPGLPRWPIPGRVIDHLQRYQVGAANIERSSPWHDEKQNEFISNGALI